MGLDVSGFHDHLYAHTHTDTYIFEKVIKVVILKSKHQLACGK